MLLYAHWPHTYTDRATRSVYGWDARTWREVPENVGLILLATHPVKFCDVTGLVDPSSHQCEKAEAPEYETTQMEPSANRMMYAAMSPQRRRKQRDANKRSRRARLHFAES